MIAAAATLIALLAVATLLGQALLAIAAGAGRERPVEASLLAPAVGLAALLVIAGLAARLPGHGTTALVAIAVAALAAALYLRGRLTGAGAALALALPVVAITSLVAALPFALAGHLGVLGAGLLNDDMASHLLIAEYVRDPGGYVPTFVRGGYPIGPHAVVVALGDPFGADLVDVFAGFTLALAPLTGIVALGLLDGLGRWRRILGACLVALSYLGASYIAQGAFKEPLQALLLIAFAVLLAVLLGVRVPGTRPALGPVHPALRVLPLALLAAAAVFNYSLPGLLWVGAVGVAVLAARHLLVRPRPELPPDWPRRAAPYALGALVVVVLATVQEWSRIADFARLEALNPDRFGSDLGNLKGPISPLEALGIWPTGDYRTSAAAAGGPAIVFWLGGALAAAALLAGMLEARRRRDPSLPAALAAIALVWAVTALFSTPYIAAKALAIAAPVAMLIALRGVLAVRGATALLALAFVLAAGLSSLLALRQAPVGPEDHAGQLAEVREEVAGEEVLFLGRDDFIGWHLRGSDQITGIVENHYSVEEVRGRFQEFRREGEKFDVDAVFPATLDEFTYILATRGGPVSTPPPRFVPVVETRDYVLWERTGLTGRRKTLDEGIEPGAVLDCATPQGRRIASGRGTAQIWETEPLIARRAGWRPDADVDHSTRATHILRLTPGRWLISLEYDSRRPLRVSSPELGLDEPLAANLDFRGPTPFFPVGEVDVEEPLTAEIAVEVERPNALGRLLRAPNEAHLRALSATPLGVVERDQRRRACDRYVDWYRAR
jgi:hypothetical protein